MANRINHSRKPREELSPHTRARLVWRNGKKVRESRWLMEQELGRRLLPTEHVHHINGDPLDNRLDNLIVMHQNAHLRGHKQVYPDQKRCANCGSMFTVKTRKRKMSLCCSPACAAAMRAAGRSRQAALSRKSPRRS